MVEFVQKPSNRNFKDLDGQQFNKLKVIGYAGKKIHDKSSSHCWWCECQCDKKTIIKVARNHLLSCDTISCGDCNLDRKFRFTTFHEFYQEFSDKLTSNSSYLADIVFVEKPSTRKFIDKQGQRFGSVLVIGFAGMLGDAAKNGY